MWRTKNKSSFEDKELLIKVPPHMIKQLPHSNLVIDSIDKRFHDSIRHLNRCDVIGVSLTGKNIGRRGHLEWLCLSTAACTYFYDIRKLQKKAFTSGLKAILENKEIIKVLHDCRMPSDHLFHVYQSELTSVFDTQASDFIIRVQSEKIENINNTANTLDYCLQKYLQIPEEYLFKSSDCSFDERPLNDSARNSLIKDVIYLRLLRKEQDLRLHTPFRRCVDVFLNTLILKSDDELKLHPPDKTKVPPELFLEDMMVFEINQSLKPNTETVAKRDYNEDPHLRYQRLILKNRQEIKGVDRANEMNMSNHYGGGYSTRRDVVDFLMDKMYADGYPDRNCCSRASIFGDEEMKCNVNSTLVEQTPSTCDDSSIIDVRNISPAHSAVKVPAVNISPQLVDRQIENKDQSFKSSNPSSNSSKNEEKAKLFELIRKMYSSHRRQLLSKVRDNSLSSNVIDETLKVSKTDSCESYKQHLKVCNNASSISKVSESAVSSKINDEIPKVIGTDYFKRYEHYLEDLKAKDNSSQDMFRVNRSLANRKALLESLRKEPELCTNTTPSDSKSDSVNNTNNLEVSKNVSSLSASSYPASRKAFSERLKKELELRSKSIPSDSLIKCDSVHNSNNTEVPKSISSLPTSSNSDQPITLGKKKALHAKTSKDNECSVISELQSSATNVTQTFSIVKKETNLLENDLKMNSNFSEQSSGLVKRNKCSRFRTQHNLRKDSDLEENNTLVKSSYENIAVEGATSLSTTTKSDSAKKIEMFSVLRKTLGKDECCVNSELESTATNVNSGAVETFASVKETNLNKDLTETRTPEKPRVLMYLRNKHPRIELKQNGGCIFTYTDWPSDENDYRSACKVPKTNNTSVVSSDSGNASVEEDDPWSKLRAAFAELGPPIIDKKTRFIPAGMQY